MVDGSRVNIASGTFTEGPQIVVPTRMSISLAPGWPSRRSSQPNRHRQLGTSPGLVPGQSQLYAEPLQPDPGWRRHRISIRRSESLGNGSVIIVAFQNISLQRQRPRLSRHGNVLLWKCDRQQSTSFSNIGRVGVIAFGTVVNFIGDQQQHLHRKRRRRLAGLRRRSGRRRPGYHQQ